MPFSRRLDRVAGAVRVPLGLLALGAFAALLVPREGGSLLSRLGTSSALLVLLWHLALLVFAYLAAGLVDALLFGKRQRLGALPVTFVVTWLLLWLELGAWGVRAMFGWSLEREHLRMMVLEAAQLAALTTWTDRGLLLGLPLLAAAAAAGLLRASLALDRGDGSGRARRLTLAAIALAAVVAALHGLTAGNDAEVFDEAAGRWTTVGASYGFHLRNDGLWLPQLALGRGGAGALDIAIADNARWVRTGAPVEPVADWLARIDRGRFRARSVLVVKLDSLRWDELAMTGGTVEATPHLSRLAAGGVLFDRCYTPSSETAYSFPALINGQYPLRRPRRDYHEDVSYPHLSLADLLGPLGYRTGLFTSDVPSWQKMERIMRRDAWDAWVVVKELPAAIAAASEDDWLARADREADVARRVEADSALGQGFDGIGGEMLLAWVGDAPEQPFVAVLDLLSPHYPYRWPADLEVPFHPHEREGYTTFFDYPPELTPVMRNAYRNALYYADGVLGQVLAGLDQLGLGDDLVIAVVADHGQSFHERPGLVTHARGPHDTQARVPLILRAPGLEPARRGEAVSMIDVPPTVLGLLGLPAHGAFQGFDVLAPETPRERPLYFTMQSPMTRQEAVVAAGFKYVEDLASGRPQLYDLTADPREERDLVAAGEVPEVGFALRDDLRAWHMSQLVYYANPALYEARYPPRYERLWDGPE